MNSQKFTRYFTNTILTVIILFLISISANAQYFLKAYQVPSAITKKIDIGRSIQRDLWGTDLWSIAGYTNSNPAGDFDWTFLKLDNLGNIICSTVLGFPYADSCFSHTQILADTMYHSSRFVLSGFYTNPGQMKRKASFSILDTNCNHILSKQINDTLRNEYRQVIRDNSVNSNFVLTGFTEYPVSMSLLKNKIIASRYNSAGAKLWGYKYTNGYPSDDEAYSICNTTDGGYAITGRTNMYTTGTNWDVFVTRLTPAGIPMWTKIYHKDSSSVSSEARRIILMPDGGFVITGWTNYNDPSNCDILVMRINSAGALIWSYTIGIHGKIERGYSIILASDGNLVLTGLTNFAGNEDVLIVKITPTAPVGLIWARYYNNALAGSMGERGYDLKESFTPAGYAFTGIVNPTALTSDIMFMKTNVAGLVNTVCPTSLTMQVIQAPYTIRETYLQYIPFNDIVINPQWTRPVPTVTTLCNVTGTGENNYNVPTEYKLKQNYPNPFNPTTNIEFSIPNDGPVSLKLYDISGKEVFVLLNENKIKGSYIVSFNASELSSGVYFYKLESGSFSDVKTMTLIK